MIDKKTGELKFTNAKIEQVVEENYRIKTFIMDTKIKAMPGQFIMVWVPKIGERPISLLNSDPVMITVANVGPVSEALHKLKKGDTISFRGPYGTGFTLGNEKNILLVGGGYGVVPLFYLAKEAKSKGKNVTVVIGARNEKDIIFEKRFNDIGAKVIISTDDGSKGFKGNALEASKKEGIESFDLICSCGPEKMMYYLAIACKETKIKCQLSLERYMKCGMGLCGSCDLNGLSVCRDGPVFEGDYCLRLSEFGKTSRDAAGNKKNI